MCGGATLSAIWGLLTSTIHVLVVTPILFSFMNERALRKGKLEISQMSAWMKEGQWVSQWRVTCRTPPDRGGVYFPEKDGTKIVDSGN